MLDDVLILGAGIAGLQCARRLQAGGAKVRLVDRADKVGGRCATRWFDGQAVDYGPLFLHGHQPAFLDAVQEVDAAMVEWPRHVEGHGMPCQPDAFAPYERRFAFVDGVNVFAQHLGRGLDVTLATTIVSMALQERRWVLTSATGQTFTAAVLVLALPLEQAIHFLLSLPDMEAKATAVPLLEMFASVPCLTLLAGYGAATPRPRFDVTYPGDSPCFTLMAVESSKRPGSATTVMVYQAQPRWSRQRLQQPKESWLRELLDEAGQRLGAWAATPAWTHAHRWRYARVDRGNELANPLLVDAAPRARLGLCGDIFAPGGGIQAAWLSGERLADRILTTETP